MSLREIARSLPTFIVSAYGYMLQRRRPECVLFAWMVCEQLLSHLWDGFAASNSLDSIHERDLREGRAFTPAARAETLRVGGILPDETYMLLTTARRHRNLLAHNGQISGTADEDALRAMEAMLVVTLPQQS